MGRGKGGMMNEMDGLVSFHFLYSVLFIIILFERERERARSQRIPLLVGY